MATALMTHLSTFSCITLKGRIQSAHLRSTGPTAEVLGKRSLVSDRLREMEAIK